MTQINEDLSKLINTFNDKRVISEGEIEEVLAAIINILAENKKGVQTLNEETKQQLKKALDSVESRHNALSASLLESVQGDLSRSKVKIEQSTKLQNNRAFKHLQDLIAKIKMPVDGLDGKNGEKGETGRDGIDGSPDTPVEVRDKLETLKDEDRLDASAIKNLPKLLKKGKEMMVGGVRFLENLLDVSILITDKRKNLLIQYDTTDNRWEGGVALTVGTTAPSNPKEGDIFIDTT